MVRTAPPRPRIRPVALFALVLAALVGGTVGHAPREAGAKTSSSTPRGYLGVSLQDLTGSLRDSYDYRGSGVLVSDVVSGSPADKAGVREGDILLRLDDDTVEDAAEVTAKVRALKPGTLLGITVVRDGDTKVLSRAEIADLSTARDEDGDYWMPAPPATPRAPRPPRPPRAHAAPHAHMNMMSGRGRLGIETHDLDADLAPYFKTTQNAGVLVLRVLEDTPAAKAGLKAGDVITTVGGKAVADGQDLRSILQEREAGDVELRVLRAGEPRMLTARLESSGQGWNWESIPGSESWMGWLDDDDFPGKTRTYSFHFDDEDKALLKARLKDGHLNDGRVHIYHDLDDLEDMDPKEREEFEREMKKLREEMKELLRDMRDLREDVDDED